MKIRNDLELLKKHLEGKKDFKVIFDGEDFGIYKYDADRNAYVGEIGNIALSGMIQAIEDKSYHIQLEIA